MSVEISKEDQATIKNVIRERFGKGYRRAKIRPYLDHFGDDAMLIYVYLDLNAVSPETTGRKLVGLPRLVQEAVSEKSRELFPYIYPKLSRAKPRAANEGRLAK